MMHEEYSARRAGSVGWEILNAEGQVVAWAVGHWAAMIVAALNAMPAPPIPETPETRPPVSR
jgi:hypothetical protein